MNAVAAFMVLFSVLVPGKLWYAPDQAIQVKIDAKEPVRLVAMDFVGKVIAPTGSAEVAAGQTADLKAIFPQLTTGPGSFVVFAVPQGKTLPTFVGTPLVVQTLTAPRFSGPVRVNVVRVEPLVYATMDTNEGAMKMLFWYDAAPNTVSAFITLSRGGFYDGLTFHRIVPGFVIQGGDPTGTGFGGPGYNLGAEFNDRPHEVGVLSMARTGDPLENKGIVPRPEFANSAGSQFFVCLGRAASLDRKYTAFGRVFDGLEVLNKIAATKIADPAAGRPEKAPVIQKINIVPVTAQDNPYAEMLKLETAESQFGAAATATATTEPAAATTEPATAPAK